MHPRSPRASLRALTALAATQGGYFTAKQAGRFGYRPPHLSYHAAHGNIERAGHGLYRMPSLPAGTHDDLMRLWLWSRARDDHPQAVVSHQTALALHELAEAVPDTIHLTVPVSFRKRAPRGCRLHRAHMARQHTQAFDAVPITTPLRTLQDLAADPTLPAEQFKRAAHAASRRGMITRRELHALLAQRHAVRATRTRRRRIA
jgi:predicted transcriptional regulator of viral defense system